jgi:GT2 family glycosyltransferase
MSLYLWHPTVKAASRSRRGSGPLDWRAGKRMEYTADMNSPMDQGETPSASVAVVVLNWNGRELTLECIRSLLEMPTPGVEIILVDNGSSDGTVDAVRAEFDDRVTLIVNDENLGFAGGNNVGIRYALDRGAEFVLLLNNDTVVDPGLVDHLLRPFSGSPGVGVTGPKIYYYTPADQIWFAGGQVYLARGTSRHIGIRETDRGQFDTEREVDYVTGCALMARREVLETAGLLDPSYVAYYEDVDFCMRARGAGFQIRYVPGGKVWHKISASTGGQMGRAKITRKFKSTWKFFRRYARPWHWLTIPFFFAADVIRIAFLVAGGRIRNTEKSSP